MLRKIKEKYMFYKNRKIISGVLLSLVNQGFETYPLTVSRIFVDHSYLVTIELLFDSDKKALKF